MPNSFTNRFAAEHVHEFYYIVHGYDGESGFTLPVLWPWDGLSGD